MTAERLDSFIHDQVLETKNTPSKGQPPQARCLQIERVAEVSVAGQLGLRRGDLVVFYRSQARGVVRSEPLPESSGPPIDLWNALAKADRG